MTHLKTFLSSGIEKVKEIGEGLTSKNMALLALTAVIATNSVAGALNSMDLDVTSVDPIDQLELIQEKGENAVITSPFNGAEKMTLIYKAPSDQFLKDQLGADFLSTETYKEYAKSLNQHSEESHAFHLIGYVPGEIDPNFILMTSNDNIPDTLPESLKEDVKFVSLYQSFLLKHEIMHTHNSQTQAVGESVGDKHVLKDEVAADVFGALWAIQTEMKSGEMTKDQAITFLDQMIQYRHDARIVERGGQTVFDNIHMSQPGLIVAKQLLQDGTVSLDQMDIHQLADFSTAITDSVSSVDLSDVVERTLAEDQDTYVMSEKAFKRHMRTLQDIEEEGGHDAVIEYMLPKAASLARMNKGMLKLYNDLNEGQLNLSEMSSQNLNAYAKSLAQMPGGELHDKAQYGFEHPFVYKQASYELYDQVAKKAHLTLDLSSLNLTISVSQTPNPLVDVNADDKLYSPQINPAYTQQVKADNAIKTMGRVKYPSANLSF